MIGIVFAARARLSKAKILTLILANEGDNHSDISRISHHCRGIGKSIKSISIRQNLAMYVIIVVALVKVSKVLVLDKV